ncbi:uncharacterized, partial [Tachysurus ichikawai]
QPKGMVIHTLVFKDYKLYILLAETDKLDVAFAAGGLSHHCLWGGSWRSSVHSQSLGTQWWSPNCVVSYRVEITGGPIDPEDELIF